MPGKVWKLMPGRWAGVTATGKRISIAKTKAEARSRAGLTSKSRTTKSKTPRRKKRNPKRRVRRTGRRKKRRGGKSLQRTVFKWLRIGALLAPAAAKAVQPISMEKKVWHFMYDYTGFDIDTGSWDIKRMAVGWGPFLGACLATYGIPKLMGILRRI